jgi:hypothetical protein
MSGVTTLVEDGSAGPKKGPRAKARTWSSGTLDGDAQRGSAQAQAQPDDDVEAGPGPGGPGKGAGHKERGRREKPGLMARQQRRIAKTVSGMRDVLHRMLCMRSALDEVDMSISPYVRSAATRPSGPHLGLLATMQQGSCSRRWPCSRGGMPHA